MAGRAQERAVAGRVGSFGLALLVSATSADTARAGAWVLPEGSGQAIATVGASSATSRYDADGGERASARFDKTEANLLLEYGLTDRVTVKARIEGERLSFEDKPTENRAGLGFSEAGARVRLLQRGGFVGSVESSVRIGLADDIPGVDADGRRILSEYEARVLAGYGFEVAGYESFVNAEAAYRLRDGIGADEVRVDLTLGTRPKDRLLVLLQSFSAIGLERPEAEILGHESHKLQASGVYDLTEAVAVQGGGFTSIAGRDSLAETGAFAALWYRF